MREAVNIRIDQRGNEQAVYIESSGIDRPYFSRPPAAVEGVAGLPFSLLVPILPPTEARRGQTEDHSRLQVIDEPFTFKHPRHCLSFDPGAKPRESSQDSSTQMTSPKA